MILQIYKAIATLLGLFLDVYFRLKVLQGKENKARLEERRGIATQSRPSGRLIWLHAVSVGEAAALLALIKILHDTKPWVTLLLTTSTVTSGNFICKLLPEGVIHQFIPIDRLAWVERFLDYWRPDLAIWMESDLWPTMVSEADRRGIHMVIVSGRLSFGTFQRWKSIGNLAKPLFGAFDLVLAANHEQVKRFLALGCVDVRYVGNLKDSIVPPKVDIKIATTLRNAIAGRPVWLAASTHRGEDAIVFDAHAQIVKSKPNLLTVIVPRHTNRSDEIACMAERNGLSLARRSANQPIKERTSVYLADTMGEIAIFYSVIPITFLAGSMVKVGGHNPMEASYCGTALIFGPLIANNRESADALLAAGGAREVNDAGSLAKTVRDLLDDPVTTSKMGACARRVAMARAIKINFILEALEPMLPEKPM
ncbi:3-Deoxy-D-manno-octulosonic-acid transferase family protein [Candidatus Endolissoclinum faulkneri L2]|uniref:3-deoxy-D-manno-octulosonic acid transferase n=1 Tax=Candidatus Endolissoclinum faulkneri L2 TaxID=1193729 RepID=K7ZDJ3_9PROT|nr:3-deoxy-D-manno-octulosonic acid transferase [Candidatus Endolissoclinum faulkneri]AFX99576.1 3-Deoxy-D-manno-octulosonic-acid transferase family protein [Candidatus Endolissoclinum faulkneri L2]